MDVVFDKYGACRLVDMFMIFSFLLGSESDSEVAIPNGGLPFHRSGVCTVVIAFVILSSFSGSPAVLAMAFVFAGRAQLRAGTSSAARRLDHEVSE